MNYLIIITKYNDRIIFYKIKLRARKFVMVFNVGSLGKMVTISPGSGRLLRVGWCSDIEVKDFVPGPKVTQGSCGHDVVHFSPASCFHRSGQAGLRLGKLVQRLRAGLLVVVELQLAHKRVVGRRPPGSPWRS